MVVSDVYAAGETPIEGISRDSLVEGLRSHGHRMVIPLEQPEDLAAFVNEHMSSGDFVVCLGAGNITAWANALPEELAKLRGSALEGVG